MSEHKASGADQETGEVPSTGGYRWVCPICDVTGLHPLSGRGRNALRALKTHAYFSAGDGHGHAETYPPDHPEERLTDYVWRVRVGATPE